MNRTWSNTRNIGGQQTTELEFRLKSPKEPLNWATWSPNVHFGIKKKNERPIQFRLRIVWNIEKEKKKRKNKKQISYVCSCSIPICEIPNAFAFHDKFQPHTNCFSPLFSLPLPLSPFIRIFLTESFGFCLLITFVL